MDHQFSFVLHQEKKRRFGSLLLNYLYFSSLGGREEWEVVFRSNKTRIQASHLVKKHLNHWTNLLAKQSLLSIKYRSLLMKSKGDSRIMNLLWNLWRKRKGLEINKVKKTNFISLVFFLKQHKRTKKKGRNFIILEISIRDKVY